MGLKISPKQQDPIGIGMDLAAVAQLGRVGAEIITRKPDNFLQAQFFRVFRKPTELHLRYQLQQSKLRRGQDVS